MLIMAQPFENTKKHSVVHFKWVNCMIGKLSLRKVFICKLYFIKAFLKPTSQVSSIMSKNPCIQGILLPHFRIPRTKRRFYRLPMKKKTA